MFKRITHTFIHVLDQDEALDFYVGKLGMVVQSDADLGVMRGGHLCVSNAQKRSHAPNRPGASSP